jgi:signal transduction histidine kinase
MIQEFDPASSARESLTADYTRALRDYLQDGGELALSEAYELGRSAVANGIGVVELGLLHHAAAAHVVPAPTLDQQERSAQFLAESLSPFEMTHRGFREANDRMEQLIRELRTKNQQLEQTTRELRHANDMALEANQQLEAFSHSVAHDLRSPLNGIIGFAELIEENQAAAEVRPFARQIAQAGHSMNALISALLEFARSARGELKREEVDLSALASQIVAALRVHGKYPLTEVTIAPQLRAYADPALMQVVLTNLLSNALKYSAKAAAPKVEFGCAAEQEGMRTFFVRDNGAGFSMAHADKLFVVFQRLHSAHAFEGHGVGLATVQRIIRRHGGAVWATSSEGQGATFFFKLSARQGRLPVER